MLLGGGKISWTAGFLIEILLTPVHNLRIETRNCSKTVIQFTIRWNSLLPFDLNSKTLRCINRLRCNPFGQLISSVVPKFILVFRLVTLMWSILCHELLPFSIVDRRGEGERLASYDQQIKFIFIYKWPPQVNLPTADNYAKLIDCHRLMITQRVPVDLQPYRSSVWHPSPGPPVGWPSQ